MPEFRAHDGTTITYRTLGTGALPLVLVHGWMVSGAIFEPFLPHLGTAGMRLLIPDQRGTGASGKPANGYTLDAYAADILAMADAEKLDGFVVLGHSMGGQIAQLLAARHPARVRGLMLINPVPASGMAVPEDMKSMFRTTATSRDTQAEILRNVCTALTDAELARMLADAAGVSAECLLQSFEAWSAGGFADELERIDAPTLVLATDDPTMPPAFLSEAVVSRIRKARLAVLPGCGHYPQCERPRELAAIVNAFLCGL